MMIRIRNRWNKMSNSVRASIAFIFSTLIIKGFIFIVTPIFTRIMNIDEYGIVTMYNSWVSIIEIFAVLGLTSAGVFNVGLNDNKLTKNEYISSCLILCNLTTLIVFIIIFIIKLIFGADIWIDNKLVIMMFIHFLFNPAMIFWITGQRYEYKYKTVTIVSILSALIGQIFAVICVLFFDGSASFNKILGTEIGSLLFSIPIYVILLKNGKDYINLKMWKSILILSIPLIPHYLSQHIMSSSDKIMISNMVGSGDAAIYGVVSNISMIGTILWGAINASLVPYTYEKLDNKKYDDIDKLCKKLELGYTIFLLIIILLSPEILSILAPKEYINGIYCVPPLIAVIFLQTLYNLFANVEFYYKSSKGIALATIISSVINLILNYLLIPKFSYIGASYSTFISYLFLVLFHYINYKKIVVKKIYDIVFIFKVTLVFIVISGLFNLLYISNYIRYGFLFIMLILVVIKRNEIKSIINLLNKNSNKI